MGCWCRAGSIPALAVCRNSNFAETIVRAARCARAQTGNDKAGGDTAGRRIRSGPGNHAPHRESKSFPMRLVLAFLLLAASILRADTLSDLKTALGGLDGRDPVKARVEVGSVVRDGEALKEDHAAAAVAALVEDGPQGLTITWDRALLQTAAAESQAKSKDPNQSTRTGNSMDELKPTALSDYLNAPATVLRVLELARLVEEKEVAWEGRPARLLTFKLTPPLSEKDKKIIKEAEMTARLWLGADGLPVALETQFHAKGRALLVISFETTQKEEFRFSLTGRRLVVTRHVQEIQSSGGGQNGVKRSLVTLHLL